MKYKLGIGLAALAMAPAMADVSGTWEVAVREFGAANFYLPMTDGRLTIAADGKSARFNALTFSGTTDKDGLHLACGDGGKSCGMLVLQQQGDALSGSGLLLDIPVTLSGRRPAPRRAPQMHDYDPQHFENFYARLVQPVMHLAPGDSVKTRTLDSRGQDRDLAPRAPRGNPLTGPFYIDGAMPGDTLVVHLERVRTNRDTAYQTDLLASNALDSGYLREIAGQKNGSIRWKIDAAAGIARIIEPSGKMGAYTIRLSPMLGCIGVAPPRDEALGAGHLGPFGGNMDSPQVKEGATLYIPVFQPGALLFLGDGHAQQGAGELPGQGLETSMDVQFSVDVIPGRALGQTRVENADYVMIMGTGVTLDAAMKSATTEMSRWLADTYGLKPHDIAPLLGTAMEYEIAEVVDSEYNVVAKIRRDVLAQIRK
jgi:acetamidase/formamidase